MTTETLPTFRVYMKDVRPGDTLITNGVFRTVESTHEVTGQGVTLYFTDGEVMQDIAYHSVTLHAV